MRERARERHWVMGGFLNEGVLVCMLMKITKCRENDDMPVRWGKLLKQSLRAGER